MSNTIDVGSLSASIKLDTRDMDRGVRQLKRQFGEIGRAATYVNQSLELVQRGFTMMEASIKGTAAPFIEAADTAEQYRLRLDTLLGSQEEGARMFEEMSEFASQVPFEYEKIMESATALSGVMKGGVDEVNQWMPMIADLAAVSGLSIQDTTGQIIRMYSAGAGAADMFRERGINAMLGFEAGASYSAEKTRKKLIEAFEDPSSQFRGAADDLAKTWSGLLSMMADRWFLFRTDVMDSGVFEGLKDKIQWVLDELDRLEKDGTLDQWARTTAHNFVTAINAMVKSIGLLMNAWYSMNASFDMAMGGFSNKFAQTFEGLDSLTGFFVNKINSVVSGVNKLNDLLYRDQIPKLAKPELFKGLAQDFGQGADIWTDMKNEAIGTIGAISQAADDLMIQLKTLDNQGKTLGSPKNGRNSAGAGNMGKAYTQVLTQLKRDLKGLEQDFQTIGMAGAKKSLADIAFEAETLTQRINDLGVKGDAITDLVDKIAQAKRNLVVESARKTIADEIKSLSDHLETQGMEGLALATAQVKQETESLRKEYEALFATSPELDDMIDQVEKLKIAMAEKDQADRDQAEIASWGDPRQDYLDGIMGSVSPYHQALQEINAEFKEMITANPHLERQAEIWRQNATQMAQYGAIAAEVGEVGNRMAGPLADAFYDFAEAGKAALGDLAESLLKELQLYASQKSAHMLMEAAYNGVMALVAMAKRDYEAMAAYQSAATSAATTAGIFASFVAGSGLAGMAHDGITSIPEDGTWLLKKNERVLDAETNQDLKKFMAEGGGSQINIEQNIEINGGDEEGVMRAIPAMREAIIQTVTEDISSGGVINKTIKSYTQ